MKRGIRLDNIILEKIANKKKLRLLKILKNEGELNQSEIHEKLGTSYKETRRHINSLFNSGIIKKKTIKKQVGSPVMVSLRPRKK